MARRSQGGSKVLPVLVLLGVWAALIGLRSSLVVLFVVLVVAFLVVSRLRPGRTAPAPSAPATDQSARAATPTAATQAATSASVTAPSSAAAPTPVPAPVPAPAPVPVPTAAGLPDEPVPGEDVRYSVLAPDELTGDPTTPPGAVEDGWYVTADRTRERWHNGSAWTAHVRVRGSR